MRVGIDIGPITADRTGVGNYCYYLLKHLVSLQESGVELRGLAVGRRPPALGALDGQLPVRHLPLPTRLMYRLWSSMGRPRVDGLLGGLDVYHATNYFLPPVRSSRRMVTIHDLTFLAAPDLCSPKIVGPYSRMMRTHARDADAIMAYSESTKSDVVRYLDVAPEKVSVAPMAVDEGFTAMPRDEAAALLDREYGIPSPFLLFVSTLEPRKNVPTLLRAFSRIARSIPHYLVLIGSIGWKSEEIFETIARLRLGARVIRPGFIPHHKLPAFYSAADAFVFPTYYEGFGLPLLEALTCGCPVITSNNSSVPEVVGEAALCSDATDDESIAGDILRVVGNPALREEMIRRGFRQARRFSWNDCARITMEVYKHLGKV